MYRKTSKVNNQLKAARKERERLRIEGEQPTYPAYPKGLRRVLVVIDFDSLIPSIHTMKMFASDRIDCYRVEVDGEQWKDRIGWSRILTGLRKAMPRVGVFCE